MIQIKHFKHVNLLLFLQDFIKDKNILFLQEKIGLVVALSLPK